MHVDERKEHGSPAFGEVPPNAADLAALETVLRQEGRWEDLIQLHERTDPDASPERLVELLEREAFGANPERAADALVIQGKLFAERAGRLDRALLAFNRALRLRPDHTEALTRSRETLLALGRVQAAFDAAEALAGAGVAPEVAAAAFLEVARAAAGRPTLHAIAREAAQRARKTTPPEADELLAALDATAAGFRDEARALHDRAADVRDRKAAARLHLRIAELHAAFDAHSTGPAKIHENLERAFLLWPGMPEALEFLERWSAVAGDARGLAADLERFAAATPDPRGRQEILLRLSSVHLIQRNDPAASLAALERAFALDPARPEAAIGLTEALHEMGRHAEAADALERHLGTLPDAGAAAELRLRLATIFFDQLGDFTRARAEVEAVLAAVPGHARADDLLERILQRAPDAAALAALLERRAARADSAARRADLLEAAAAGLPPDRDAERLRLLGAALAAAPERVQTLAALDRVAAATGLAAPFADLLRGAAAAATGPAALPLLRRAAEVLSSDLGRHAEAAAVWSEVAVEAPEDEVAQAELERCLALSGDFEALVVRIRGALAAATDPSERRLLFARLARHYETTARDPAAAADVYRELLELSPGDPVVLGKLAASLGALERWEAQLEVFRELAKQSGAAGLAARARCAALLAERLERPDEAVELYVALFTAEPDLPGVVPALERLLAAGVAARRIAALLAPRYAFLGDHARCMQMLELELAGARDPAERRRLLLSIAAVHEEGLGDPRAAFEAVARVFAEDPSVEGLPARLERLAAAAGDVSLVADLYRRSWDTAPPEVAAVLATRVAALAEGPLADGELATAAWRRRLAIDPTDDRALEALAAHAALAERWEEAAELVGRRIEVAHDESPSKNHLNGLEAAARPVGQIQTEGLLSARSASIGPSEGRADRWTGHDARASLERVRADHLARAGRPAEAAGGYRAALAAGAPEELVLPLLAESLEASGNGAELGPVLDRLAVLARKAADADGAVRFELRAATLIDEQGGREAAIDRFGAILAGRPTEAAARAALEKRLDDPILGPRAARFLAPAYEAIGDHRGLAAALECEARGVTEPAARAALLSRLARIRGSELRDARGAYDALVAAVRDLPTDAGLRADLLDAARELDVIDEAVALLSGLAERLAASPAEATALERELALVAEHERNDPVAAAGHHERLLAINPTDEDALRNLHRLRRTLAAWAPLHDACLSLARIVDAPAERIALLREAGTLAEDHLGDLALAAADFRRLVELAPADADAWAALDRLAGALGRPAERVEAIAARRQLLRGDSASGVAAEPEGRSQTASPLSARSVRPPIGPAPGRADAGTDLERFRELTFRLAEATRDELGDIAGGVALFAELLALDPTDTGAREALASVARSAAPVAPAAFAALDAALAASGDHVRRADLREARLEIAPAAERDRLWEELRALQEVELGRPELAFLTACRAFAAGADRARLEPHLERLARETGSFEELADVYEQAGLHGRNEGMRVEVREGGRTDPLINSQLPALEPGLTPDHAATLLLRAARVREVELRDEEGAIRLYRAALDAAPSNREALDALGRLYEERREGSALAEICDRNVALASGAERIEWLLRLGRLAVGVLGDDERAIAAFRDALAVDPTHRGALEALEPILWKERRRRHGEVLDVLRRLVALAEEGSAERQRLLLRIAQELEDRALSLPDPARRRAGLGEALAVYGDALDHGDPAPVVAHLERLLGREETRAGAALRLEPIYRARGDRGHLADLLDLLRLAPEEGHRRRERLVELVALRERLGDRRAAFFAAIALFREAPEDGAIRARLADLAEAIGAHEELAAAIEDELEGRPDGDPVVPELLRLLGPLEAGPLGRPRAAATAWERLHAITGDAATLDHLEHLYRREGQLAELVTIYRRRIRLAPDTAAKRELGIFMANLMERLGDRDGAIDALREILALDEGDENALASFSRLLGDTGRWPELADLIDRQIATARENGLEAEARELTFKLGRVRQLHLDDPAGALARFREVLAGEPRHGKTLVALEELSGSEDAVAKALAAEVLAPIYEAERDWPRLVQAIEAMAAVAPAGASRAALYLRVVDLYAGPMVSPEMALVAAGRALREGPDDATVLARTVAVAEAADLVDELGSLLLAAADLAASDEGRLALLREAARRLDAAGEAVAARDAWRRVRTLAADDAEALVALSRLHRDAGEVEAYLEVLRTRLIRSEEPALRRELLLAIADAQEATGDIAGALSSCRRVLDLEPLDTDALSRMDRLCTGAERWADLALVLEKEARAAGHDAAARIPFELRLAALKESRLLDREGALAIYRDVLAAVPGQPDTVARLEALLDKDPGNREAARLLEEAYLASGAWAKYAAALDERAAATADPETRRATLVTLAEVRERRQDRSDLAFIALARAFREDPTDPGVRDTLERLARDTDALDELAGLYEEELPRIRSASAAADVALRLGALVEGRDPEGSRHWYERARELDPEVGARGLPALDRIHKAAERWPELADVLEARAALEEDRHEHVSLLFRLAALVEERLGERDRAAAAYERIVELDSRHLPSLRALSRLYEEAGRFDRLHEVLLAEREAVHDPAIRDRLTVRLAEVAAKGLNDPGRAIAHLVELLARSPRNEAALRGLEGLYEETGRWKELSALLETRLAATVEPREIARLHEKRGWVLSTKLSAGDEALRSYLAVLERDPRNRRALEAVRDLQRERGDLEALAVTLRRLVPLQDDALGVKAARLDLARALAGLGRREEAIDNARRTLDVEPHDDALLAGAEELLLSLAAFSDAVRAMEHRASRLGEAGKGDEAADLWERVADLWEERLGRKEGAAQALEKLLMLRPGDLESFERLRGIYRAIADWRRTAIATERFATTVDDPERRLALLVELAKIQEERLGQKEVALAKLGAALELAPGDAGIRAGLRRLADDTGGHEELAMLLEAVADARPRGDVAASLYLDLGALQDEVLDQPAAAESSYRRILEFDPVHADAIDALVRLFERRGDDRPYVLALEQKLEAVATLDEKKAILHAIARAYDERLHDVGEAIYSLERALEFDPGDRGTVELLAALYRREGRFPELAALWERVRDLTPDTEEQVTRQLELAALTENELGDVERAIAAYNRALELDAGCGPALDALERLYTRLDRPDDLLGVVERRMELSADGRERAKLLFRAATIREEKSGDIEGAIGCLESILQIDPDNLAAVKGLERLLLRTGDVERQIVALERHLALVERDGAARTEAVELHVRIGERFLKDLGRADRAETWFVRALELDPECREALSGLGHIYEKAGNWPLALEHLRREARHAGAAGEAVDILFRTGRIEEEMLADTTAARRSYERVLQIDPGHLPSLRALRGILEREGDLDGFLEALVQEATHANDPVEKTRLWGEVGRFQLETRDDPEGAIRAFEEARRQTPGDLSAARALADLYVAREEWGRAEGCLDVVCEVLAGKADPVFEQELTQRSYRLGFIAERAGNEEKALACFRRSYELDPTFLPAAEGLARLLAKAGDAALARNVYQGILLHHREELSDSEVVEIHYAIGDLRRRLGEPEAALKSFGSALELDPYHPEALRGLVALNEESGRYDRAFEHRRRLLEVLDGDERRRALLETATIARDRLSDPYQAIDCLAAALSLDGNDEASLVALAALYRETRQASKLASTLERLLAVPGFGAEAAVRARLELSSLYRTELRDEPDAEMRVLEHLEAALDLDWKQAGAFQTLEAILGQARDWAGLERTYVRMLARIPMEEGTRAARVLLYRTLGDLYLRALRNPTAALEAYRAVTLLAPEDGAGARAFAELLGKKPGAEVEAIAAHRAALWVVEDPARSAKALVGLHARRKEYDQALVAAQVVTHLLGQGGADEAGIVARLVRFAKVSATASLTEDHWAVLTHPKARTPVAEILGLLQEHAGALFAVDAAKLEVGGKPTPLDPKQRVDLARSELFFVGAYLQVARALGVTPRPLFQVASTRGLHIAGTHPAALVAGEELFGAEAPKKKELYFLIARRLAFARAGLNMAALHRAESLDLLVQAAVAMGVPGYRPTGDGREVERLRRRLEKALPPEVRKAVGAAGSSWLRDPARPDVRSYLEGAELTATRAAALLCADLEVAARCLETDPGIAARLPPETKKRDLVVFCLGEDFSRLRQALKLSVEIPG